MAHEFKIKNGLIINNTQIVTGVTNSTPLQDNDYTLVAESAIKNLVDTLSGETPRVLVDLQDVGYINLTTNDFLVYNGSQWVNSAVSYYTQGEVDTILDDYYTKTEVYNTGETYNQTEIDNLISGATGILSLSALTDVTFTGAPTNGDFLVHNGSEWVNSAVSYYTQGEVDTILDDYYTKTEVYNTGETYTKSEVDYLVANSAITELEELTDVNLGTLANGEFLMYNGVEWVNSAVTKAIITDFVESDYVHTTGDEYIQGNKTFAQDVQVAGNFTVSGTTTYLNVQDLNVADNIITINSGETGAGVTNLNAGTKVDRGSSTPYYFVFNEPTQTFRIGASTADETPQIVLSGDTQAVATREDSPLDESLAFWNDTAKRFDTDANLTWDGNDLYVNGISLTNLITGSTATVSLSALTDTVINSPAAGEFLTYDGSNWVNSAVSYYTQGEVDTILDDYYTKTAVYNTGETYTQTEIDNLISGATSVLSLSALTDVTFTGAPTNGDFLVHDGNEWVNSAVSYYTQPEIDDKIFQTNTAVTAADDVIDTITTSIAEGSVWHYVAINGVNRRAGTIVSTWDGSTAEWNETTTQDIGTTDIEFKVIRSGGVVELQIDSLTGTYNVYVNRVLM